MRQALFGILMASTLAACAPAPFMIAAPGAPAADAPATGLPANPPPSLRGDDVAIRATDAPTKQGGPWVGAAGDSDFMLSGSNDTVLGVWVDVPAAAQGARAPADVALVIDTSGSMAGPKIENARLAARELVEKLTDGDILSIFTFSDAAQERVPPLVLTRENRPALLRIIANLEPLGGTNMFEGLRWAEHRVQQSPATHTVRRVVMISDGMANVGPSSPDVLGALAARGADGGVQVSAIGVGSDYDEHTLNALAVRSSGRLYHLEQPREMTAILDREIGLLQTTAATGAFIEIVPAPGVDILGADGVRLDRRAGGAAQIPLGTMFGGQHREMLLHVRVNAAGVGEGGRALASVRLHFHDPSDSGLERVQEVVARYQVTADQKLVEAHANDRTRTIAATQQAAQITIAAAQQLNDGRFGEADQQLAAAETQLKAAASRARNEGDRQRVMAAATHISKARAAAQVDAAAPPSAARPAAARARALDVNAAGMKAMGF